MENIDFDIIESLSQDFDFTDEDSYFQKVDEENKLRISDLKSDYIKYRKNALYEMPLQYYKDNANAVQHMMSYGFVHFNKTSIDNRDESYIISEEDHKRLSGDSPEQFDKLILFPDEDLWNIDEDTILSLKKLIHITYRYEDDFDGFVAYPLKDGSYWLVYFIG